MKNPDLIPYRHPSEKQKRLELIVFGEDWGAHPSSTQHLIKRLMPDHDIVWMNSLGLRRPKFNARDLKRAYQKISKMWHKPEKRTQTKSVLDQEGLDIVHPRAVSWPGNPMASLLNKHLLGQQIDSIIERHDFEMPILWTSLPSAIDAIENYPNHKVVYYCGDDFRALAGVDHSPVEKMEERLATRADLIITASKVLQNRFPADKTILIEHGVDYDLFSTDVPRASDLPEHPLIAGFYGSIHDWLDLEMITQAAQACPQWKFVFIGDVHIDIDMMKAIENIEFLGPRPHHELPHYAQHWNVSLLPFRDCGQIRACNPLKLKEYLCSGQPIISTDFPALEPYRQNVHIMRNAEDLIATLAHIKEAPLALRKPERAMQKESWDHKVQTVEKHLLSL